MATLKAPGIRNILNRLRANPDAGGFTLIELLVVVVIIGVLAAIAVGVYLDYRQGAADKSAQSDVRGTIPTVEHYYTDNDNTYPATSQVDQTTSPIAIGGEAITLSDKTHLTLYVASATAKSYKICAYKAAAARTASTSTTAASVVRCRRLPPPPFP